MFTKLFVLAFASLVSASLIPSTSHAAVCPANITCGTYEGSGAWYTVDNKPTSKYSEKIVITGIDAQTANIKVYIYSGTIGEPWTDSNVIFDPKSDRGQFVLTSSKGYTFGTGFCNSSACTFSFAPVAVTDENPPFVNTFVDILRFEGNKLTRYNMVADSAKDAELMTQRSVLVRK